MKHRLDFTFSEIKLADDGAKTGVFSGYGAVFGNVDSYGDVIERGAFKTTLREWEEKGKLPPMLLQHGGGMFGGNAEDMLPVGKWTAMEENSKGLKVEGQLFALGTEKGQYIVEGLKAGVLDGLSIGFRVKQAKLGTKPGEPRRTLTEIDLMELSIVTFPANPKARVTAVKGDFPTIRELEQMLVRDAGLSAADVKALLADGYKAVKRTRDAAEAESVETSELAKLAARIRELAK